MNFSKVAKYKINIQKLVAFLYTLTMKYQKRNVKKRIPFRICIQKKKKNQTRINLIKEVKDLYAENYKTLIKEIRDDSKKWKDITYS